MAENWWYKADNCKIRKGKRKGNGRKGRSSDKILPFCPERPKATIVHRRITTHPALLRVVNTATVRWTANRQRAFFGYSYTAPTPCKYILQKLGPGIIKAFLLHLGNSFRKLEKYPNPNIYDALS